MYGTLPTPNSWFYHYTVKITTTIIPLIYLSIERAVSRLLNKLLSKWASPYILDSCQFIEQAGRAHLVVRQDTYLAKYYGKDHWTDYWFLFGIFSFFRRNLDFRFPRCEESHWQYETRVPILASITPPYDYQYIVNTPLSYSPLWLATHTFTSSQ